MYLHVSFYFFSVALIAKKVISTPSAMPAMDLSAHWATFLIFFLTVNIRTLFRLLFRLRILCE